jgi:hypothetical protein
MFLGFAIGLCLVVLATALLYGCATADPPEVNQDRMQAGLEEGVSVGVRQPHNRVYAGWSTGARQRFENISVRHVEMLVSFTSSGTQLRCVFDTQTARATDGHISDGPALNDADIQRVRDKGLCQ